MYKFPEDPALQRRIQRTAEEQKPLNETEQACVMRYLTERAKHSKRFTGLEKLCKHCNIPEYRMQHIFGYLKSQTSIEILFIDGVNMARISPSEVKSNE